MLLASLCVCVIRDSLIYASVFNSLEISYCGDEFRAMALDGNVDRLRHLSDKWGTDFGSVAVVYLADSHNDSKISDFNYDRYTAVKNYLIRRDYELFFNTARIYDNIINCMEVFPASPSSKMTYENTFGDKRTYGGDRKHEGTDIMPPTNERGVYPVRSVCNGTVENVGWLTLGGYRIGIRSDTGIYFYYAHLQSYAGEYRVGDRISAGEVIGLMGDSGYGAEGTTGEFDVHLHFGIYISDKDGGEISINPYPYLIYLSGISGSWSERKD